MRNPKGPRLFSPLTEILGLYRAIRAALLPPCCRFAPSCSEYAEQAVERFGVLRAAPLILSRLLRCHPFHPGGHDPVPARPVDGAVTAAGT